VSEPAGLDDVDLGVATRRGHTAAIVAIVLVVVAGLLVWVFATSEPATDRRAQTPLQGKVAPALAGTSLEGEAFDIDEARGRWVIVNFVAAYCVPCRREHPELVEFAAAHDVLDDAQIVAVIYDDDVATVRRFFDDEGGDWPVLDDPDGRIALDYGVTGVPETFVVSPDGLVVTRFDSQITRAGLDALLAELDASRR
jgi:cytochrome c biogenesis protein CcmG, thiol:disulfide interchange protein DsbE